MEKVSSPADKVRSENKAEFRFFTDFDGNPYCQVKKCRKRKGVHLRGNFYLCNKHKNLLLPKREDFLLHPKINTLRGHAPSNPTHRLEILDCEVAPPGGLIVTKE